MGDFIGVSLETLAIPGVLLGIAVVLLLTGKLIPRRTYEDMKDDRDHWRAAYEENEKSREMLMQTLQSIVVKYEDEEGE